MAKLLSLQKKVGKASLIAELSMPVLFLAAALLTDHSIPGSSITISCLTMALLGISLFQVPGWLLYSAIIFSIVVVGVSFNSTLYEYVNNRPMEHPIQVVHYTRTVAFILLSCFCVLFSIILQRFRSAHDEMLEIITRFPKPLLLCDLSGKILYSNSAAKERFHFQPHDPQEILIADIFAPESNKGVFIREYIKAFERFGITSSGEPQGKITIHFEGRQLLGEPISLMSSGNKNIILTISE